jgi:hypothetical protein
VTATATYKGVMAIYDKAGKEFDRVELTFNLPPGIPRMSHISYDYSIVSISEDTVFLSGDWKFNVKTSRATGVYVMSTAHGNYFSCPWLTWMYMLAEGLTGGRYECDTIEFVLNQANWGDFATALVSNKYGCTHSPDTLCSTDYITDPDVLEVINRLKEQAGVGYVPENRDWTLRCDGRTAAFGQEALALIRRVWLCDVYGRIYESDLVDGSVDISMLPKGFNAIIVETSDNRRQTFKVVRR